jgi:hypothetical protein
VTPLFHDIADPTDAVADNVTDVPEHTDCAKPASNVGELGSARVTDVVFDGQLLLVTWMLVYPPAANVVPKLICPKTFDTVVPVTTTDDGVVYVQSYDTPEVNPVNVILPVAVAQAVGSVFDVPNTGVVLIVTTKLFSSVHTGVVAVSVYT